MKLILQIIKKDLRRYRWAIGLWAASFLYGQLQPNVAFNELPNVSFADFFKLGSGSLFLALTFLLVAGLIQEDSPEEDQGAWRTRPISAGHMLAAKLLLIVSLFVVVPVSVGWGRTWFVPVGATDAFTVFGFAALAALGLCLSFAAIASCTRSLRQCMITWLGIAIVTLVLAVGLDRVAPQLSRFEASRLVGTKASLILGVSSLVAIVVLLNQYLWRRQVVSFVLLATWSIGSAVIATLWTWNIYGG